MQHLRRNWPVMAAVAAVIAAGGLGWGLSGQGQASADPEPPGGYAALTGAEHDAVLEVMAGVGLDRDAATALNVNAAQAEELVSAVRNWWVSAQQNHC